MQVGKLLFRLGLVKAAVGRDGEVLLELHRTCRGVVLDLRARLRGSRLRHLHDRGGLGLVVEGLVRLHHLIGVRRRHGVLGLEILRQTGGVGGQRVVVADGAVENVLALGHRVGADPRVRRELRGRRGSGRRLLVDGRENVFDRLGCAVVVPESRLVELALGGIDDLLPLVLGDSSLGVVEVVLDAVGVARQPQVLVVLNVRRRTEAPRGSGSLVATVELLVGVNVIGSFVVAHAEVVVELVHHLRPRVAVVLVGLNGSLHLLRRPAIDHLVLGEGLLGKRRHSLGSPRVVLGLDRLVDRLGGLLLDVVVEGVVGLFDLLGLRLGDVFVLVGLDEVVEVLVVLDRLQHLVEQVLGVEVSELTIDLAHQPLVGVVLLGQLGDVVRDVVGVAGLDRGLVGDPSVLRLLRLDRLVVRDGFVQRLVLVAATPLLLDLFLDLVVGQAVGEEVVDVLVDRRLVVLLDVVRLRLVVGHHGSVRGGARAVLVPVVDHPLLQRVRVEVGVVLRDRVLRPRLGHAVVLEVADLLLDLVQVRLGELGLRGRRSDVIAVVVLGRLFVGVVLLQLGGVVVGLGRLVRVRRPLTARVAFLVRDVVRVLHRGQQSLLVSETRHNRKAANLRGGRAAFLWDNGGVEHPCS